MTTIPGNGENVPISDGETTQLDALNTLKRRYADGEDILEEATALLLALHQHQSRRIQFRIEITDEEFGKEEEFANELEAMIFIS